MPRAARTDVGGYVYHVLNRANARVQIFDNNQDYLQFENILERAVTKYEMRLLAYCLMPNHWHLVIHPRNNGEISPFMAWLTNTHTRQWHTQKGTVGQGHLYQGRFKSFLCQEDNHFLTLVRYVERNAKRAKLVRKAEDWPWSSVCRRMHGTKKQKQLLAPWPIPAPRKYKSWLNQPQTPTEELSIQHSIQKGYPHGEDSWVQEVIRQYHLESTSRSPGRPRNGG